MAALIRAAISRRERSTSARSASSPRDASSASIRRALLIEAAAWSASARTSPIADGLKASVLEENAPSAPKTVSPETSGATTIERMPMSRTTRSVSAACGKAASSM